MLCSFDRIGYARHRRRFRTEPERDLRGRTVWVTGGTDGIGRALVDALAARGARVVAVGRDAAKGRALEAAPATFLQVDVGDLEAVRTATAAVDEAPAAIVLNAGAMPLQRQLTKQGHELVWASQVLGHLLMLRRFRAAGALAPDTRVIWVSSGGMYLAPLDLSDLRRDRSYQRHSVYANAKRAQVELASHLASEWPGVPMASMHPGWVATGGVRTSMPLFHRLTQPILRTREQGADTLVWLVAREMPWETGRFWFDREPVPEHLSRRTHTAPETRAAFLEAVFAATEPFLMEPSHA